jgi:hypothetical protein
MIDRLLPAGFQRSTERNKATAGEAVALGGCVLYMVDTKL